MLMNKNGELLENNFIVDEKSMHDSSDFNSSLKRYQLHVNRALSNFLLDSPTRKHNLTEAMRYSVIGGGGKRIRPAMVYAAGEATGADQDTLDTPACAVEMIHAYSLIHDDLADKPRVMWPSMKRQPSSPVTRCRHMPLRFLLPVIWRLMTGDVFR